MIFDPNKVAPINLLETCCRQVGTELACLYVQGGAKNGAVRVSVDNPTFAPHLPCSLRPEVGTAGRADGRTF